MCFFSRSPLRIRKQRFKFQIRKHKTSDFADLQSVTILIREGEHNYIEAEIRKLSSKEVVFYIF